MSRSGCRAYPRARGRIRSMTAPRHNLSSQAGFSLVELVVAMAVLLIGVTGVMTMLDRANQRTVDNRAREAGTALAREVTERVRSLPYPSITSGGLPGQLQSMQGLSDDSGDPGWQIRRRGVVFTLTISACSVDDGKDSYGTHDASSWCAGGGAPGTDRNPDDYKRVTLDVTWSQPDAKGRAHEQTLINSPGNAAGPAVTNLVVTQPASVVDKVGYCENTGNCPSSLTFRATTSVKPATLTWAVDGADRGPATGANTTWDFVWDISTVTDGAYLISARAFDSEGRSSAQRARTITLNRFVPIAPRGFAAGRNGAIVDAEWVANPERDVLGYRVYRQVGGGPVEQVGGTCADYQATMTRRSSCYDSAPPAGNVVYWVRAVDRDDAGALRNGTASTSVTVTADSTAPGPVTNLSRSGSTLTWSAPAGTPAPAFYRIYRDGSAYADRYDRTGGPELTWTEGRGGGTTHTYWVTAVSSQLAESTATGPVTMP